MSLESKKSISITKLKKKPQMDISFLHILKIKCSIRKSYFTLYSQFYTLIQILEPYFYGCVIRNKIKRTVAKYY